MATVTRTYLVDDLDGSDDDVATVLLSVDKKDYEIDLSATNQARLREKLATFLDAATPVRPQGPRRTRTAVTAIPVSRDQTRAIRVWARSAGFVVSERGRIPKNVQDAFNQAH
jgi:hypothetical protein